MRWPRFWDVAAAVSVGLVTTTELGPIALWLAYRVNPIEVFGPTTSVLPAGVRPLGTILFVATLITLSSRLNGELRTGRPHVVLAGAVVAAVGGAAAALAAQGNPDLALVGGAVCGLAGFAATGVAILRAEGDGPRQGLRHTIGAFRDAAIWHVAGLPFAVILTALAVSVASRSSLLTAAVVTTSMAGSCTLVFFALEENTPER